MAHSDSLMLSVLNAGFSFLGGTVTLLNMNGTWNILTFVLLAVMNRIRHGERMT
jgi:hypothetical protein